MRPHIALAACLPLSPAVADDDGDDEDSSGEQVEAIVRTGLVHDALSRAKKQPSVFEKTSGEYADFKTRMADEHGLTWSFSLSYRQRRVRPDDLGTSSQQLFWPTLNWDIFANETYGSGSFQFLYYGERQSSSTVKLARGSRMLNAESRCSI